MKRLLLKPCPFCGGPPTFKDIGGLWIVKCAKSPDAVLLMDAIQIVDPKLFRAAERWNARIAS